MACGGDFNKSNFRDVDEIVLPKGAVWQGDEPSGMLREPDSRSPLMPQRGLQIAVAIGPRVRCALAHGDRES